MAEAKAVSGQSMKRGTAVRKLALIRYSVEAGPCALVESGANRRVQSRTKRVASPERRPKHPWRVSICRSVSALRLRANTKYTRIPPTFRGKPRATPQRKDLIKPLTV